MKWFRRIGSLCMAAVLAISTLPLSSNAAEIPQNDANQATFSSDSFSFSLDETGVLSRLTDTSTGTNYLQTEKARSLISIYLDEEMVVPSSMTVSGNDLTFTFDEGVTAIVEVEEKANYINLEVTSLENKTDKDLRYLFWGPIPVDIQDTIADTLGVVYNDDYAIGMMALNVKTVGSFPQDVPDVYPRVNWTEVRFPNFYSAALPIEGGGQLRAFVADYTKDRTLYYPGGSYGGASQKYDIPALDPAICGDDGEIVGSKIALYGCATEDVLDIVSEMEVAEGMPHPTNEDGQWQKDPVAKYDFQMRTEYLFPVFDTETLNRRIQDARRLGAELMYGHDTFQTYNGDYRFKGFESYEDFKTNITDVAHQYDLTVGTKNRPAFLNKDVPNANGIENVKKNIVRSRTTTTKTAITSLDVGEVIQLEDMTDFPTAANNEVYVLVDEKEVIKVKGNNGDGVVITARGQQQTTPIQHEAGVEFSKLSFNAGYGGTFRGTQQYIHEAAMTLADSINTAGMSLSDMDGLEDSEFTGHNIYMDNKTMDWWYNALENKNGVKSYSSGMTQWGWHIFTAQTWGEKYLPITDEGEFNYRLQRNYDYYVRNFFPVTTGLCGITQNFTEDDMQFLGSKAAAYATQLNIADEGFGSLPNYETYLDIIREWTTARDVNAFTMEQRMRMAPYSSRWRLETVEPGIEWNLIGLKKENGQWVADTTETAKAPGVENLLHRDGVVVTTKAGEQDVSVLTDKQLDKVLELGEGPQYIQIDLGEMQQIDQIRFWHDFAVGNRYHDVVVQLASKCDFSDAKTIFNNDADNSLGLGAGSDEEYSAPYTGKTLTCTGSQAQYVRIWSNGNNADNTNGFAEVQVLSGERTYAQPLPREFRNGAEKREVKLSDAQASSGENANLVRDNKITTAWFSGRENESVVTVKVDDKMVQNYELLKNITIRWGNQNVKEYRVEVQNQDGQWNTVYTGTDGNGAAAKINLEKSVSANAIRVVCTGKNKENYPYAIAEIKAYTYEIMGGSNLALGKSVTFSGEAEPAPPATGLETRNPEWVTDGDFTTETNYFGIVSSGKQYIQIDLGVPCKIDTIKSWRHYFQGGRTYYDVIMQVSNDPEFKTGVTTVFNNDKDNSSGLGIGTDEEFLETAEGKTVTFEPVEAQYVRLWTNGNSKSGLGNGHHYYEVEVYGEEPLPPEGEPLPDVYTLTVNNGSGSGEYEEGEEVTVTAAPAEEGKHFAGWTAEGIELSEEQMKSETITFAMPANEVVLTAEYELMPVDSDKRLLQKTYDYALTLSTEGVTDSAKAYFEKVLAEAKAVLNNVAATQDEVNTAWDNLLNGIWGLGLVQGDKTMLEQLIAKADAMIPEQDKYVQDNWQQLADALDAAKKVMEDGDAMEEDIEPAAEALLNAILAQRFKADKSILEDLVNKSEEMDLSGYTAESVAVFTAAFQNAKAVLADETLSEDDQAVVDEAVEELEAAIENLSANDDGDTTKPDDGKDDGNTDNGTSSGSSDKNDSGSSSADKAPTTGDNTVIWIWAAAAAVSLMLAALVIKLRRREDF